MPVVAASMTFIVYFSLITFVPLRVRNPPLPVVTGIVAQTLPLRRTTIRCLLTSTVLTMDAPTENFTTRSDSSVPHAPSSAATPFNATLSLTLLLAGQKDLGR